MGQFSDICRCSSVTESSVEEPIQIITRLFSIMTKVQEPPPLALTYTYNTSRRTCHLVDTQTSMQPYM
jgi:hypothetical protein